jgi:hypothetical protein
MPSYRCYFLDEQGHVRAAEDIDADALSEAIERALAMLKERDHHRSVEVWDGANRLYPVTRIL